jgi:hypothetical protein
MVGMVGLWCKLSWMNAQVFASSNKSLGGRARTQIFLFLSAEHVLRVLAESARSSLRCQASTAILLCVTLFGLSCACHQFVSSSMRCSVPKFCHSKKPWQGVLLSLVGRHLRLTSEHNGYFLCRFSCCC